MDGPTFAQVRHLACDIHDGALSVASPDEAAAAILALFAPLRAELEAARQRARALLNAGHDPRCGGIDTAERRCECGWLQGEGAHEYILTLERERDAARAALAEAAVPLEALYAVEMDGMALSPDMKDAIRAAVAGIRRALGDVPEEP